MHIDSYQFGRIVIDGTAYTTDCLIIAGAVHPDWWRKQGHMLSADDLAPIVQAAPSVLVIGTGASAMMKVPDETGEFLERHNIRTQVLDTHKAVTRLNKLAGAGESVAAALHLTC